MSTHEKCENCNEVIKGAKFVTGDDYVLCVDCWVDLKDDMEAIDAEAVQV